MINRKLRKLLSEEKMNHRYVLKSDEDVIRLINIIADNNDLYSDKTLIIKHDPTIEVPIVKLYAKDIIGSFYPLITTLNFYINTSPNKQIEVSIN